MFMRLPGLRGSGLVGVRRLVGVLAVVVLVAGVGVLGVGVASAFGAGCEGCLPWWHVTVGARPSLLPAGTARDEVQELVTTPGGGGVTAFTLLVREEKFAGNYASPVTREEEEEGVKLLTAANVQVGLERRYGAGNVVVSEEPDVLLGPGAMRFVIMTAAAVAPIEVFENKGTVLPSVLTTAQGSGDVVVVATNLGDATVDGETAPVTVKDTLPAGVRAVGYEAISAETAGIEEAGQVSCELQTVGEPRTTTCTFSGTTVLDGETVPRSLPPYHKIEVRLEVAVEAGTPSGGVDAAVVSGGGARSPGSVSRGLPVAKMPGEKVPFGIEDYEVSPEEPGGVLDRQAGSHPFQTTFTLDLNQGPPFTGLTGGSDAEPAGLIKDFKSKLPPGFIGNPTPFPRCTLPEFQERLCPADTILGVATTLVNEPAVLGLKTNLMSPVFNLEPSVGEPARFGFLTSKETPIFIDSSVRNGGDYGIDGESNDVLQDVGALSAQVTLWGVPGDARHDESRGFGCLDPDDTEFPVCRALAETNPPPLFSLPTSCTGHPLESEAEVDSWEEPGVFKSASTNAFQVMPTLVGCERLPFEPSIRVTPDGTAGSTPTGLDVDVHVPQEAILNGTGLAQSAVKDITVALPEGVAVDPSDADGLEACPEALLDFQGFQALDPGTDPGVLSPVFLSKLPGSHGSSEQFDPGLNFCSDASKIGTAEISIPVLPATQHLKGAVYLAAQEANPFGSLLAMYIVAEDPVSGVLAVIAGQVHLGGSGQLVTTVEDNPQAPFEDADLHFFGGERAPLATPAHCGAYTTNASFVPWAAEPSDEAALTVHSSSTFDITSGPHGTACPGASLPFSPALTAGAVSNEAGGYSPFTMTMSREDGQQPLKAIELQMPPGLSGKLAGVELCPEPQASQGLCGANSLIGETTISVGVGGDPYTVTGGHVYLTGPYEGAPFGLSIVNPAKAGPFDLAHTKTNSPPCDCVLVRAKIQVNPITAVLTVTSPTTGPYAIPTILEGIPLQIQHVNVTINRPSFTFNPTNCDPLAITGLLSSSEGATDTLNVPLQVANCATLKFQPKVTVSAAGHASKLDGASLHFKVSYPTSSIGTQTWIQEAKFDLPKQLPARLETLQQACLAHVFETNKAACPKASIIGTAIVHTQVLPVPLTGKIYFVSYGAAKFPEAVMVLEGYGITIDLHGETFINKTTGVTSATFHNTPDVPFQTIEATIPTGRYSEFGANLTGKHPYNFCGHKLTMPTLLKAQNGQETHQNTPITITGCTKTPKHATKHHKHTKH